MLYVHDALNPGLTVIHASHVHPDGAIYNCVALIYGPVLMALQLKHDTVP